VRYTIQIKLAAMPATSARRWRSTIGWLEIEVRDWGRRIDWDKVRQGALRNGLAAA
jgi:hypothetical protein